MNKEIENIIESELKEFEKLGGYEILEDCEKSPLPVGHLTRGLDYPESPRELDPEKVKSFIRSSHFRLLEQVREQLEWVLKDEKEKYEPAYEEADKGIVQGLSDSIAIINKLLK